MVRLWQWTCAFLVLTAPFLSAASKFTTTEPDPSSSTCPKQLVGKRIDNLGPLGTKLVEIAESHWKSSDSPGISISVVSGDKIVWSYNGGYTNLQKTTPVSQQTKFRIASVTKAFTSTLLYQLVSKGIIQSAEDRIRTYIPSFSVIDPSNPSSDLASSLMNLRHLSSHLAGLPREPPCSWDNCNYSTDVMLKMIAQIPLLMRPNTRPSYSNLGSSLLGHILGEYTSWTSTGNRTWESLLENFILNPLKMSNSGAFTTPLNARDPNFATGYSDGNPTILFDIGWNRPAGSMYSTTEDLSKYLIALMSDASPLMDQITLESFFYPIFALRDNVNLWGAPWEAQRRYDYTVLRKGGGLAGFSSFISFIPELKFGISILMNSDTGAAEDITFDMWTQIIPFLESVLPSLSIAAPSPNIVSALVGVWSSPDGMTWNITSHPSDGLVRFNPPPYYYAGPGYLIPAAESLGPYWLQTFHPDDTLPCFRNQMGLNYEYLVLDLQSNPASFRQPYFWPARIFYKLQ